MAVGLALICSYIFAGIPTAYLVAKYLKGMDIRQYGTGNVGASNLMQHISVKVGFAAGFCDGIVKGLLPILTLILINQSPGIQIAVALGAVSGHNWSPYLRFSGGRGIAVSLGIYLAYLLIPEFAVLAFVGGFWGWYIRRDIGLWMMVGMAFIPIIATLLGRPEEVITITTGITGLLLVKRLTANWEKPVKDEPLLKVMFFRLLYDRDIADHAQWVSRKPI